MEQVSEALAGDPMHVAAFMETLQRCKAKAISPAAAHEQVCPACVHKEQATVCRPPIETGACVGRTILLTKL